MWFDDFLGLAMSHYAKLPTTRVFTSWGCRKVK